jgi:hypothetical protein
MGSCGRVEYTTTNCFLMVFVSSTRRRRLMISGRRWCAFWLLVRIVGWLSWMTWDQALAFQGTVAVVYPETDDPAYRVVFESVIQSLRTVLQRRLPRGLCQRVGL